MSNRPPPLLCTTTTTTTVSPWIVRKSIKNIFQNRTMQVLIVNSNYANLDMHSAVWKKNRINTSFTVCKSALYKDLYCTITTIPPKSHNETQTIYGAKMCKKCRRHWRDSRSTTAQGALNMNKNIAITKMGDMSDNL